MLAPTHAAAAVPVTLSWPHAGKDVRVAGTFNEWRPVALDDAGTYRVGTFLVGTVIYYKFVVDGDWVVDRAKPHDAALGADNNYIVAAAPVRASISVTTPASAARVLVAGSFNDWATQPLERTNRARMWSTQLSLLPGDYSFKFQVDGEWMCSDAFAKRESGSGTENNVAQVYPFSAGLTNADSRCFLNAAVQLFYATPAFRASVLALWRSPPALRDSLLLSSLGDVLNHLDSHVGPVHSHELHAELIKQRVMVADEADDAAPLCTMLLHELCSCIRVAAIGSKSGRASANLALKSSAMEGESKHDGGRRSSANDWAFCARRTRTCGACTATSGPFEEDQVAYMPLTVPTDAFVGDSTAHFDVADMWRAAWAPVQLPGFRCTSCGTVGRCVESSEVRELPNHLFVQLVAGSDDQLEHFRSRLRFAASQAFVCKPSNGSSASANPGGGGACGDWSPGRAPSKCCPAVPGAGHEARAAFRMDSEVKVSTDGDSAQDGQQPTRSGKEVAVTAASAMEEGGVVDQTFELDAVIAKSGGVAAGHFVCVSRQRFPGSKLSVWWVFDDANVWRLPLEPGVDVSCASLFREYAPVLLAYSRTTASTTSS